MSFPFLSIRSGVRLARVAVLCAAIAAAFSAPAYAQELSESPISTKPIYVHTATETLKGQLFRLGPEALSVLEQGTVRELKLSDVTRIEAPGDSVRNGAIIGAAILGAWCAIICPQGLDGYDGNEFVPVLLVNFGLGALVGAGIDGMHVGRTTIYRRDPGAAAARRTAKPRASVSLGFKF